MKQPQLTAFLPMKTKDVFIVALAPLALLLLPLVGSLTVEDWNWTWSDFLFAYIVFTLTTAAFRLLLTRTWANLAYKLGAAIGIMTGFFITWVTMAVQIIGDENPTNLLYPLTILGGAIGLVLSRLQPACMAKVAFSLAAAIFMIPIIAVTFWPADFSPGVEKVFILNFVFVLMFVTSGLLFRRATGQASERLRKVA